MRRLIAPAAIVLLAFLLREWYVLTVITPNPFQGDSAEYWRYAANLAHGFFGLQHPDDYRTPGYPLFLALCGSISAARQAQVVIGTLTVLATILLARLWLPRWAALSAGLLLAVWPHHIVASDSLLSEVLFGFLLTGALLATALTLRQRAPAGIAGAAWGLAYLVNPLVALLPVCALAAFWRAGRLRAGMVLLAVATVTPAGWALRSATLPPSQGRAAINIVQGSWPDFHASSRAQIEPWGAARYAEIQRQVELVASNPRAGWAQVADRMRADPWRYVRFYATEKPMMLWGWGVQLGAGDIYFLITENTPYDLPGWYEFRLLFRAVNPLLTLLTLAYALLLLRSRDPVALLCGGAVVYLTALHIVFQAEPRYAIAYRPLECVVLAGAFVRLAMAVPARFQITRGEACPT